MADEISEYIVRDYSAIDRQVDEIARRERILTNRLNLENLKKFVLIGLMVIGGICLLFLALAIAYRIAFPPEKIILENPLPVEVTVKNEPVIIKETSKEIQKNKVPSNRIFGIPDTNTNISSNKSSESKNTNQNTEKKVSKLDNTTVVTFKKQNSNLTGFGQVTTGWQWKNPNADNPFNEYCYITNIDRVRIDLAKKNNNLKKSLYDYYIANRYNLTKKQWNNLESKCQWYSN